MRHYFLHILFLVTAMAASPHLAAQEALFDKYEDTNGVTTIFISKKMLSMIPNVKAGKRNIESIASRLDYLRVLSCEKTSLTDALIDDAKKAYRSGGYEAIMTMTEGGEKVTIYQRTMKDGKNEFSLLTKENNEVTIINIMGNVTLKDIKDIQSRH